MTKLAIVLDQRIIEDFCLHWKIRELSVFGSVLRPDFRPDSDIDFLVDFEDAAEWGLMGLLHMQDELERITGRKVDVMTKRGLEFGGNRRFQREVLQSARRIHATQGNSPVGLNS